jgi:hypothetical protein
VHGAATIGAGIDRREADATGGVGSLVAAKEAHAASAIDVGVVAAGIALPDIDDGVLQRRAGGAVLPADDEFERQRHAGAHRARRRVAADVGAIKTLVDEIRALGLRERQAEAGGQAWRTLFPYPVKDAITGNSLLGASPARGKPR